MHKRRKKVKTSADAFLNIMSNFIPKETKRFVPGDPPWRTKLLKTMLNRKIDFSITTKKMVIKLRIKLGAELFVLNANKQWKLHNYLIS